MEVKRRALSGPGTRVMTRREFGTSRSTPAHTTSTQSFSFFDTAYAATLTVVLLVLLAALAIAQFLLIERRVHYR